MPLLISLVITTFNYAQFLGQAIESVLQQTYPYFELLIWDDGSADNSIAVAQAYAKRDNRVRVIAAKHQGRAAALANAIAQTKGTYLGWLDSDDFIAPTTLEETVNVLNARPEVGMVYTDYYDMDEQGQRLTYGQRCQISYSPERLLVDFMAFQFRLMRRSTYLEAGEINRGIDYAEDYDFCLRLSEVTQVERVRKPLYYYRSHPGSISHNLHLKQTLNSYIAVRKAIHRRGMADTHTIDLDLASGRFTLRQLHSTPAIPTSDLCRDERSAVCSFQGRASRFHAIRAAIAPLLTTISLIGAVSTGDGFAQSIAPANDGTNTVVTPAGNQFNITGGTVSTDGTNLFHSFERFGLTQGQIANFLANPQLQNILGRVVGNNPSVIDGLIRVTGGTPNLYLLNPAGIVFGSNASLNVPSSFIATTANGIGFGCSSSGTGCQWFNAVGANNDSALVGNPTGFIFNSVQPGAIVNAGNLAVNSGNTLALVGGTVVNTGQLSAPGGQIVLSTVPGGTFARLSQPGSLLSLEFKSIAPGSAPDALTSSAPTLAQLLTGGSLANATGLTVNPDGSVALTNSNTSIPTTSGATIVSGRLNTAGQTGGTIAIVGQQVGLVGASLDASGTNGGGSVYVGGQYQGKGTLPTASQTYISPNSVIDASAKQNGAGGTVIVWADKATDFRGTIRATGGANSGNGGFVEVSGKETLKYRGTAETSAAKGRSGTLLLDPRNITVIAGGGGDDDNEILDNSTILFGDGGSDDFTISQDALSSAASTGSVILQATNDITFQPLTDGLLDLSLGSPGNFTIEAGGAVTMNPTDRISGSGWNVTIRGGSLSLGSIDTSADFDRPGNGGNITLQAQGNIQAVDLFSNGNSSAGLAQGGAISVTSNAGTISVGNIESTAGGDTFASGNTVTLQTLSNGGNISFQTINAEGIDGGNVNILARGQVRGTGVLPFSSSTITTQGSGYGGTSGTIRIEHDGGPTNQPFVVGGAITASSGNGTVEAINAGDSEVISSGSFDYSSSPYGSPDNRIQITFRNDTPTLTAVEALSTSKNTPLNLTVASLGISTFDANADNPLFVRVASIQPGATLQINGVTAVPGTLIPTDATIQYVPPADFVGLLTDAFSITVDDQISTSAPRSIALFVGTVDNQISTTPSGDEDIACALNCNIPPGISPLTVDPTSAGEVLLPDLPEGRFSRAFVEYLGLAETPITASIDEQRAIAQQIEQDTGAKPAFLYVSFVPASLKVSASAGLKSKEDTRSIEIVEQDSDQLEVIVITANGSVLRTRIPAATRDRVMQLADELRQEVADPRKTRSMTYLSSSRQFYQWLIAPIQNELKLRQITNLVFLMDAGLRSLPVAALHDGQGFLVEQYSIGLMPSVSLTDTRYRDIKASQLLSLGISESTQGQIPLPSVQVETATIVNDLWSGQLYLNEKATINTLKSSRQQRPYGIVHLATHADFLPGSQENSYIQFWEEKLRLDQLRDLGLSNPQVQLLVLSACSTALGDREAELGFGGLAVQAGVKSAVASLWSVNDVATAALVTRFYRDLKTTPIKAEALRQAQLAILRGQVYVKDGRIEGIEPAGIALPEDVPVVRDEKLTHPYYWSGFTMIGNPW